MPAGEFAKWVRVAAREAAVVKGGCRAAVGATVFASPHGRVQIKGGYGVFAGVRCEVWCAFTLASQCGGSDSVHVGPETWCERVRGGGVGMKWWCGNEVVVWE
eukprot:200542-Chlamydomonas_euryale.AAC.1